MDGGIQVELSGLRSRRVDMLSLAETEAPDDMPARGSRAGGSCDQPQEDESTRRRATRRWVKDWVPHDTALNAGKLLLLKWMTEETRNALIAKQAEGEQAELGDEQHEVVYLCSFEGCGKVFSEPASLRKHAHVHGEKQFICHYEGCDKRFMDSSKLKRHFLIHTGEKHFMCPFEGCGKAFSLDFNLRSHVRIHTGENYHVCPFEECGKRYAHEYKLKKHVKMHHDSRLSGSKVEPVQAEREVIQVKAVNLTPVDSPAGPTSDRPHACPYEGCTKCYIHSYKLKLHLRRAHQANLDERINLDERTNLDERASDGEEDVDNSSEHDPTSSGKVNERGKASGKGKARSSAKTPASSSAKRKRGNTKAPSERNAKRQAGNSRKKNPTKQQIVQRADSEETVDEDGIDGQPESRSGGRIGVPINEGEDDLPERSKIGTFHERPGGEDDEETEDDLEY